MSATPTLAVRVARKVPLAEGICGLELVAADGGPLPAFTAGAHIDLHLPGGPVRPYSLCNPPGETHRYRLGVLRDAASRGGSQAVHEQLQEGQVLAISPPRNLFALVDDAPASLLIAGGIGITPLLAMAARLAAADAPFQLHYASRTRRYAAFVDELARAPYASRVHLHFDDEAAGPLPLDRVLDGAAEGTHLYVCGPAGLIQATLAAARARGWPEARLHHESFTPAPVPGGQAGSFEVALASTGQVVAVPAGQTIVQALAAAGVEVMTSCEQGVCGTCLTRVLAGQPDHRDSYLTPEERAANDQMLVCCSRSRSPRLVLDL
ncbi:2Fe-2S iron-sulfur cluster-binding protein [Ideonella sp.]|uniref:PDR/VanB family oxidoreductase n=1 Tax=Ideonella sp. TaxID=1929293 RepID=UPI0035B23128